MRERGRRYPRRGLVAHHLASGVTRGTPAARPPARPSKKTPAVELTPSQRARRSVQGRDEGGTGRPSCSPRVQRGKGTTDEGYLDVLVGAGREGTRRGDRAVPEDRRPAAARGQAAGAVDAGRFQRRVRPARDRRPEGAGGDGADVERPHGTESRP